MIVRVMTVMLVGLVVRMMRVMMVLMLMVVVSWPKSVFSKQKKHQNFAKISIFLWEKGTFLFAQHFPVAAWCPLRSEFFVGPKSSDFGPKLRFRHTTPNFVNGPFVALGETVHFQPLERFFDFSFPSYAVFVK